MSRPARLTARQIAVTAALSILLVEFLKRLPT
jgi:hypothetical protein